MTKQLYVPLWVTVIPGHAFQYFTQQLLETTSKRDTAHGVKEEIDTEVSIVEKHEELLQTPE